MLINSIKLLDILINLASNDKLIIANLDERSTKSKIHSQIRNLCNLEKSVINCQKKFDDGKFFYTVEKFIVPLVTLLKNKYDAISRLDEKIIQSIIMINIKLDEKINGGQAKKIDVIHGLCKILDLKKRFPANDNCKIKSYPRANMNIFINLLNGYKKIQELEKKVFHVSYSKNKKGLLKNSLKNMKNYDVISKYL